MRINSIKLVLLVFCLMPLQQAIAEEKIDGAFGMNLGQLFDPDEAIGKASLRDGTPLYQFNPEKKFRSFSKYYVLITPKSHKVYEIWATGNIKNTPTCKKEKKLIMAVLKEKYGEAKEQDLFSALYDADIITQGDRQIIIKCTGFSNVTVEIRYKDNEFDKLAESERIELEKKELDSSGL